MHRKNGFKEKDRVMFSKKKMLKTRLKQISNLNLTFFEIIYKFFFYTKRLH